ncbi:hypothetical protein P691DRAFT_842742 [Macrolepiota fuliginosa MF-IS2]|uniref:Uncharacterized protein n=1 Tax=Macrolepiota fuliginosa MF-IS2 TaxID=1400762 RepID=A0A9P5X2S2_9AGAR|nr:hypothetical protein P691DRAFT_842742 [Macrolepiota fuliginosa MF-IS2]
MDGQQEAAQPRTQERLQVVKTNIFGKYKGHMGVLYYIGFITLEACFAILAFHCWRSPLELSIFNSDFEPTSVKSAFQTIFNLWHNIAIALAASICAETFSKEWAASAERTDVVSKVTSGMIDRIVYFFRLRATRTYRTAFLASLILILMSTTSSSTITVSSVVELKRDLPITHLSNINLSTNLAAPDVQGFIERLNIAGTAVQLEKLGGSPWGLSPEPNWLIPLPLSLEDTEGLSTKYHTDLVSFWHNCDWRAPDSVDTTAGTYLIDDQGWTLQDSPGFLGVDSEDPALTGQGSTIRQLWPPTPIPDLNGTSVYLFLGGNSTISVNTTNIDNSWIDLSGLPTLYNPSQFIAYHPTSLVVDWVNSPLATLLVCQPGINLTTGLVKIAINSNILAPDVTVYDVSKAAPLGNIDPKAANLLFSIALSTASNVADQNGDQAIDWINFSSIASKLFMPEPPSGNWQNSSGVRPLPLDTINSLMDDFQLPALKAFTTGNHSASAFVSAQAQVVPSQLVEAQYVPVDGLFLATGAPYAFLYVALVIIEVVLLLVLVRLNLKQGRSPFDLAHLKGE